MTEYVDITSGQETILRVWRIDGREVMREIALSNGNLALQTWDVFSATWRNVMWFENTPQTTGSGRTGIPHLGEAQWFWQTPGKINTEHWVEFRRGGTPQDPEPAGQSIGRAWIGADEARQEVYVGTENNQRFSILTSDLASPHYPNTADRRLSITPGIGAHGRALIEIGDGDLVVRGQIVGELADGERLLLLRDISGNWRLGIRCDGNQVVIEAYNGLSVKIAP